MRYEAKEFEYREVILKLRNTERVLEDNGGMIDALEAENQNQQEKTMFDEEMSEIRPVRLFRSVTRIRSAGRNSFEVPDKKYSTRYGEVLIKFENIVK